MTDVAPRATFLFLLGRWTLRWLQRPFGGLAVYGAERLPASGPVIVAVNHVSYLDPVVAGMACARPVHFMARQTLFDWPVFGSLIRRTHAVPVAREGDPRSALRACGRCLDLGQAVLMFPEGTRSRTGRIGPLKGGIGLLAARHHATVSPLYLDGTFKAWPKGRMFPRPAAMRAYFGQPIPPPADAGRVEQARVADATRAALLALEAAVLGPAAHPEPCGSAGGP